jgi:hypothetical protein
MVTANNSCNFLVRTEEEARDIIDGWASWAKESTDAWADAEGMGSTYNDKEELYVNVIHGFYEVEDEGEKKDTGKVLAKTIIAYRYRDVVGISAKYIGEYEVVSS